MKIKHIKSRKILNSAAKWTIETQVALEDGSTGTASIPGGISRSKKEAVSLPADKAVKIAEKIKDKLEGKIFPTQKDLDNFLKDLDGTPNKSKLGGNTILSISTAFCKAGAQSKGLETYQYLHTLLNPEITLSETQFHPPEMMMLMLEGGLHGSGNATIQEFMAIVDTVERGVEIYTNIKEELTKLNKSTNVGAEGAFSPKGYDNEQMLSILNGFLHGEKIAIDAAASSFPPEADAPNYDELVNTYAIGSIEDPYAEDDWTNWELFGQKYVSVIKPVLTIVTDDLTATNPILLQKAIEKDVGNAIIIKPNQIGTVTETLEVVRIAQDNDWKTVVSHRGTDTEDDFIADLAVGTQANYTKFGAPAREERVVKYNRLLEIAV